jgi:hypothetical protein
MANNENLYCKIYVDANIPRDELIRIVARLLGGTIDRTTVSTSYSELDIMKNEDFDETLRKTFPDGFLHFRYYVDIESLPGQQRAAQIALVANLLEHLWSLGFQAVAACDYEEQLPRRGGYKWRGE